MGTDNTKALKLAARFAMPPNTLGYCGSETAPQKFNSCVINGKCKGVDKELENFIVLHPYLVTIAQLTGKSKFDYDVIEAYCIGNKLLHNMPPFGYDLLLQHFKEQGVPPWFIDDLKKQQPQRFIPHHLFQVLHVGVGKASGAVPFNLDSINNCMVRWGPVIEINKKEVSVNLHQLKLEGKKYQIETKLGMFDFSNEFLGEVKIGDFVAVHWNQVIKVLTLEEEKNLSYWTHKIIKYVTYSE